MKGEVLVQPLFLNGDQLYNWPIPSLRPPLAYALYFRSVASLQVCQTFTKGRICRTVWPLRFMPILEIDFYDIRYLSSELVLCSAIRFHVAS